MAVLHPDASDRQLLKGVARSGFGRQADSRKASLPSTNFRAYADRTQAAKQFISSAHTQEMKGRTSPGPGIYTLPSSLDKQLEAQKQTAPQFSFAHEQRLKPGPDLGLGPGNYKAPSSLGVQHLSGRMSPARVGFGQSTRDQTNKMYTSGRHLEHKKGTLGPDPGAYNVPSSMGPQAASHRASAPAWSAPKVDRLKDTFNALSQTMPAPGKYSTWRSMGKQTQSQFKTLPAFGFGTSTFTREEGHRFISLNHTRALKGHESPAHYNHQSQKAITGFGNQILSQRASPASFGFSKAPKTTFKTSNTPGPGAYD